MSIVNTNYMTGVYSNPVNKQQTKSCQTESVTFRSTLSEKSESAVDQYKRKHPDDAAHVDAQVQAGKAVWTRNGVENVSREDMTMEEYKNFINGLLKSIPFDSTRIFDKEMISISDAGWEQMKNDPDYEAWVLGYTVQNRSVRNPFFGCPGASGSFYVEKFGASIEEHIGQSVGNTGPGSGAKTAKNEKSWWERRHEKMEELIEAQAMKAREKAKAERKLAQEQDLKDQIAGKNALAAAAYEENMSGLIIRGHGRL